MARVGAGGRTKVDVFVGATARSLTPRARPAIHSYIEPRSWISADPLVWGG
jgi:hypothetical protein